MAEGVKVRINGGGDPNKTPSRVRVRVSKKADEGNVYSSSLGRSIEKELPAHEKSVKGFFNHYMTSPLYTQRLISQGYDKPSDAISLRLANIGVTTAKKDWREETMYSVPRQGIYINPMSFGENPDLNLRSTVAHEYSHAGGALLPGRHPKVPSIMAMNSKEADGIYSRNKYSKLSKDDLQKLSPEKLNDLSHDLRPSETKADLDAIRYMLYTDGIYDTGTQKFNKDVLKKARAKYSNDKMMKRLSDSFSDDDIIWMMNNIAKASPPKISTKVRVPGNQQSGLV